MRRVLPSIAVVILFATAFAPVASVQGQENKPAAAAASAVKPAAKKSSLVPLFVGGMVARPVIAVPNSFFMAVQKNEPAAYGRSLTY